MDKTIAIINPKSAGGKTSAKLDFLKKKLKQIPNLEIKLTEYSKHAKEITNKAIKDGFNHIIAIGGDGTFNEVLNGFFEKDTLINPDVVLSFVPSGTGSDFIKTLEVPNNIDLAIKKILEKNIQKIDIGKITFDDGNIEYFLNAAEVGMGAEIVDRVNKSSKKYGGTITFFYHTLLTALKYKNNDISIIFDNDSEQKININNLIIGNGKFIGGGMKVLPDANLFDNFFDIMIIKELNIVSFFKAFLKVYFTINLKNNKLEFRRAKKIIITSSKSLKVESDGELKGLTNVFFEVIPNQLSIC
ncbi:MAG: diacylglycerol kinase family protein [Candidatus Sericytochromatia bacterium]